MLGPLPFVLYTIATPLSYVINGFHIPHHLYADDSQLYASFSANDSSDSLSNLQPRLELIQRWMRSNIKTGTKSGENRIPSGYRRYRSLIIIIIITDAHLPVIDIRSMAQV